MTGFDSKRQMAADKLQEHKALKLALEALEAVNPSLVCDMAHHSKKYQHGIGQTCPLEIRHLETITAIKAALAQPAQERDFSCKVCGNKPNSDGELEHGKGCYTQDENGGGSEFISDAVTAPQPAQKVDYWIREATAARQAEMALRRELESLAQPAQKPAAYVTGTYGGRFTYAPLNPAMVLPVGMALYSAPQEKT